MRGGDAHRLVSTEHKELLFRRKVKTKREFAPWPPSGAKLMNSWSFNFISPKEVQGHVITVIGHHLHGLLAYSAFRSYS
jgi:hypothetical protein